MFGHKKTKHDVWVLSGVSNRHTDNEVLKLVTTNLEKNK